MDKQVVLFPITLIELKKLLAELIEEKVSIITERNNHKVLPETYLTREEVCKLLRITLPTLSNYTSQRLLKGYKIGDRVLYKRQEIDKALTEIGNIKFKR